MASPFESLRHPDRNRHIRNQFYQGAHWRHAAEHLLAVSIVSLNDGLLDLDVRHSPRLALNGRAGSRTRTLTIHHRNIVRKRKTIKIGQADIQIGDRLIVLDDEEGALRLIGALVDEVEQFWNAHGRTWLSTD